MISFGSKQSNLAFRISSYDCPARTYSQYPTWDVLDLCYLPWGCNLNVSPYFIDRIVLCTVYITRELSTEGRARTSASFGIVHNGGVCRHVSRLPSCSYVQQLVLVVRLAAFSVSPIVILTGAVMPC